MTDRPSMAPRGDPLRLDFYLPPPSDRAYRWGKVQRLRDQITAWRRSAPRRGAAGGAAPHLPAGPRWHAAAPESSSGFGASFGLAAAPYYHDQTHFCEPVPRLAPAMCYGVTTNREEAELVAKGADAGDASELGASWGVLLTPSFAVKARSAELAATIHSESTQRRASAQQQQRTGSGGRQSFARTAEIAVDWGEFTRLSAAGTMPLPSISTPSPPPPPPPSSFAATASAGSTWDSFATSGRRPLRIYSIHIPKDVANSVGAMKRAAPAPRNGEKVTLPKAWTK